MNTYGNEEIWKKPPVADLHPSEKIEISNFGRIRSFKVSEQAPKLLSGSWLMNYNILTLKMLCGKKRTFYIHRLVAQLFVQRQNEQQTFVLHKDYRRSNNHYTNLFWATKAEMLAHRKKDSLYSKKKIRNAKLTERDVIKIKKLLKEGRMTPYAIARRFHISPTHIKRIQQGENWAHIKV